MLKNLLQNRDKVIVGIRPEKMESLTPNYEFIADVDISEMLGSEKIVYFMRSFRKSLVRLCGKRQVK